MVVAVGVEKTLMIMLSLGLIEAVVARVARWGTTPSMNRSPQPPIRNLPFQSSV